REPGRQHHHRDPDANNDPASSLRLSQNGLATTNADVSLTNTGRASGQSHAHQPRRLDGRSKRPNTITKPARITAGTPIHTNRSSHQRASLYPRPRPSGHRSKIAIRNAVMCHKNSVMTIVLTRIVPFHARAFC